MLLDELEKVDAALRPFERVRLVHVEVRLDELLNGFHVQNGLMTPSFKLRRAELAARYRAEFESLYEESEVWERCWMSECVLGVFVFRRFRYFKCFGDPFGESRFSSESEKLAQKYSFRVANPAQCS